MIVNVSVHLERPAEGSAFVWWAETDRFPTLSVAAPSLRELEFLTRDAVRLLLLDEGVNDEADLRLRLVGDVQTTAGDELPLREHGLLRQPLGETEPSRYTTTGGVELVRA